MQSTGQGSRHLPQPEHSSGMMMTSIPWLKMAPNCGGQCRMQVSQLMHSAMSMRSGGFFHFGFRSLDSRRSERLRAPPDLILCDGHGYAHPRRFGIASHFGVYTGIPAIGVAKSRLVGEHGQPMQRRGAWVPLTDRGETIGAVVRTRPHTQPIYVSIGHRVSLPVAVRFALACATDYRLPETTRWAHQLASGEDPSRIRRAPAKDEG